MGGIVSSIANIGSSIIGGGAKALGSVVGGVGDILGGLLKPKVPQVNIDLPAAPPPQEIQPPPTLLQPAAMPTPNSSEVRQAGRKAAATQLARKGRSSTIMTNTDALGG